MTRAGKSNVSILMILTTVFAALAGVGFFLEEQERHGRLQLQQRVAELTRQNGQLEEDLGAANHEKERLQGELASTKEEANQLTAKLNDIAQHRDELQQTLAKRDEALQSLNKDLEAIQGERERLNKQLGTVREQARKLENQLAQLKQERGTLESKLEQMKGQGEPSAVELAKVVVTPEGNAGAIPPPQVETTPAGTVVTGRVLVVNREYDFVVMNVGKSNGVKVGDEFEVLRDSKSLGRVKVEKIYEALSAAALLSGTDKQTVHEGDTVRSAAGGST